MQIKRIPPLSFNFQMTPNARYIKPTYSRLQYIELFGISDPVELLLVAHCSLEYE